MIAADQAAAGADYYTYTSPGGVIPWSDGKLGDDQFAVYHPSDNTYWTAQAFSTSGSNVNQSPGGGSSPGFGFVGGGTGGTVPTSFCGGGGRLTPVFTEIIIVSQILPPSTTLTASADPIPFGQSVTLTATTVSTAGTLVAQAIDNSPDGVSWAFGSTVPGASWAGGPAAQNTLAWGFTPPAAGNWHFRAAGTDSVGVSNVPEEIVTVDKATPTGTFAGQSLVSGTSLAGLLSAEFANPYNPGAARPTGAVAYSAPGFGPISDATVLPEGEYAVTAAYPGDSNYNAASVTAEFTVTAPAPPSASITASPPGGTAPLQVAVVWSAANASSAVVAGTGVASSSISGSQNVVLTTPGTYVYTITASGPGGQTTRTASVTAGAAQFVLTTGVIGNGSVTPGGTYPAGSVVSVSAAPGNSASFTGWTGGAAGTANPISVTMNGNLTVFANFLSAQPQTIVFSPPPTASYPGPSVVLAAAATSGLPVQFALLGGPALLKANLLSFTGPGPVVVQASQGGNQQWLPAAPVTADIQVDANALVARLRFNPSGNDARVSDRNSAPGGSFIWTDASGVQASPWPTFGNPQPLVPVQQNTVLPEVRGATGN
jgi:uncharacterized repeat protein (TIGR02543 family)